MEQSANFRRNAAMTRHHCFWPGPTFDPFFILWVNELSKGKGGNDKSQKWSSLKDDSASYFLVGKDNLNGSRMEEAAF